MNGKMRELQKEQTKQLLIKAAYDVFSDKGITSARMSDIANKAGVSHGTMFVHFATQEALIIEVIEKYGNEISLRMHELADTSSNLRAVLSAHLAGISEFEAFYTRLVLENRLLPPAARDSFVVIQSAISFHFSKALALGTENRKLPSYLIFNMWIGLVHYYLENSDLFAPDGHVLERYSDILIKGFIELLNIKESDQNG